MLITISYGAPVKRGASPDTGTVLFGDDNEVTDDSFYPSNYKESTFTYNVQAMTYKSPSWPYEKVKRGGKGLRRAGLTEKSGYNHPVKDKTKDDSHIVLHDIVPEEPDKADGVRNDTKHSELSNIESFSTVPSSDNPDALLGNTTDVIENRRFLESLKNQTNSIISDGKSAATNAAKAFLDSILPKHMKLYIVLAATGVLTFTICCIFWICGCYWSLLREIRKVPRTTQRRLEGKDCYDDTCGDTV